MVAGYTHEVGSFAVEVPNLFIPPGATNALKSLSN